MKDGMKMIGFIYFLMILIGIMMIGHDMREIGAPGIIIDIGPIWMILRALEQVVSMKQSHISPQIIYQI